MASQATNRGDTNMDTDDFTRTPQMRTDMSGMLFGHNSQAGKDAGDDKKLEKPSASASGTSTSTPADAASTTDLDLLLIGKSGVGKSATGNSILGKKVFKSSASLNSVTDKISSDISKVKERIIKVVDGPGVGDTRMDTDEGIRNFVESMEHAMFTNPSGYHCFLLVLRFGTRFTQEDIDTIALLKKVFGGDFVKDYCVLVMTCGDMFKYEAEENDMDFPEWVSQQRGAMAELVKECQGRIVLFDNVTKKQEEKAAQLDQLLARIGSLNNNGKRYTDSNFQGAMNAREKVIAESKIPLARDETLQAITLLMQELGEIRSRGAESEDLATSEAIVRDLEKLLKDAAVVRQDVTEQDKGTGALNDLIQSVETVEKSIANSLDLHRVAVESRQRQQESETEVVKRMRDLEEQMTLAKEESEKKRLEDENRKLKMEMEMKEMKYKENLVRLQENHRAELETYGYCQTQFYTYQRKRESSIMKGLKLACNAMIITPAKAIYKILKAIKEF